jgi:hypothetical protein
VYHARAPRESWTGDQCLRYYEWAMTKRLAKKIMFGRGRREARPRWKEAYLRICRYLRNDPEWNQRIRLALLFHYEHCQICGSEFAVQCEEGRRIQSLRVRP